MWETFFYLKQILLIFVNCNLRFVLIDDFTYTNTEIIGIISEKKITDKIELGVIVHVVISVPK